MNKKDLLELIALGEGYTLEFKQSINDSLSKEICAFANSSGGKIILGINDSGQITGFELNNSNKATILNYARNIDPEIKINYEQVEKITVIHVPQGKDKPYFANGSCYICEGAITQKLKRDEIHTFFQKENKISFEKQTNHEFNSNDFDYNLFYEFLKKANISKNNEPKTIMNNLNLLTNKKVNNAGILFFAQDVKHYLPNAIITCTLFLGRERIEILDSKELNKDFISNYKNTFSYLSSKLNTRYIIKTLKRQEILEIPPEALREAIINAMTHRDYFSLGKIQIDIFHNRVEISNPGKLLFDKKELGKTSLARNPIIFDLTHRLDLVEKAGTGIKRIKEKCKKQGIKIKFETNTDYFRIIFYRKKEIPTQKDGTENDTENDTVKKLEDTLIQEISQNPRITINELASKNNKGRRTIIRKLNKLKQKNLIKRIGPDKGGHWEVKK